MLLNNTDLAEYKEILKSGFPIKSSKNRTVFSDAFMV